MRYLLGILAALALPAAVRAEDFNYKLTFPDGTPGVMRARVEKSGDKKHTVTCDYSVSQEQEMGLPNMPLGSWHGTDVEKGDRVPLKL
jgi:hypothetical protein